MANRFWWPSGGTGTSTGNWSSTTNWSSSDVSYVAAAVPTVVDDVFIIGNAGSAAFTVTISTTSTCNNLAIDNPFLTLAGSGALNIYGSVGVYGFASRTFTGTIAFLGQSGVTASTIAFGGMILASAIVFSATGKTWALASALTTTGAISLGNGTLDTSASNFSLTVSAISLNSGTKSLKLNGSNVVATASNPLSLVTNQPGFSLDAGTSTITCSATLQNNKLGGLVFYNFVYSNTAISLCAITGGPVTYNNLTFVGKTSTAISTITFDSTQTINGSLTISTPSSAGNSRYYIQSATYGIPISITGNTASLVDVDFRDINHVGTTWIGTRLGDAGGNSGITFSAPKTVFWNIAGSTGFQSNGWAATSTGTPATSNFPLPQDTAFFTDNLPAAGSSITISAAYNLPVLNFASRTNALTFATGSVSPYVYGDIILSSAITLSGTGAITWGHRSGTATIISAGRTWTQPITIACIGATLALGDAFNSSAAISSAGAQGGNNTFTTNGFNLICTTFSNSVTTNTMNLGASTVTITGAGAAAWTTAATVNAGTSTISLTSASAKTFAGNGKTYYNLNQGGAGALTVSGNNTFNSITNSVQPTTVTFAASSTNTFANFSLTGTAGNLVTINSSTAGSAANFVKTGGVVSGDYLSVQDISASPASIWYAGANSTNVSGNTGWIFTIPPATVDSKFFLFF